MKYSNDGGNTWTSITTPFDTILRSISWNGREAIATGNDASYSSTLIISTDGVNWSSVTGNSLSSIVTPYVEWNGNEWIITRSGGSFSVFNSMFDSSGIINVFSNSSTSLLTTASCVGVNNGIGAKVFNDRLYLNAGDKLVVYGPSYYDSALMSDTSISMNMNLPV